MKIIYFEHRKLINEKFKTIWKHRTIMLINFIIKSKVNKVQNSHTKIIRHNIYD